MKRFLAVGAAILVLDQVTKALVVRFLASGNSWRLIGDVVRLRQVHNTGSAFGLFQASWLLFVAVSVASIGAIFYLVFSRRHAQAGGAVALGLVLGGALGNLADRLWLHRVIDFIDIGIGRHRWPTFNVADIGLTLGVLFLALSLVQLESRTRPSASLPPEDGPLPGPDRPAPEGRDA